MRILRKIKDWFKYDIPYGIQNLRVWFPVIWKDRNFDFYFIYAIMRHKLHLMEKSIRKYGCHVNAEKDADDIKRCVLLLDRLMADGYHENAFKKYYERWGDPEMTTIPCKDDPNLHSLEFIYENVHTEMDEIIRKKQFSNAFEHERYLKEQDKKLLFKMMEKHIEGWWD